MICGGKQFDDTPIGYFDAADHVASISSIFADDAMGLRDEGRRRIPWWSALAHYFGRCLRCKTHSTDEGIGGRCIDCGKVHGWVTRDELRAYGARMTRKR